MLKALGSSESVVTSTACCYSCSGLRAPSAILDFLVTMPMKQPGRKPKPVRHSTDGMADTLKLALCCEREKIMK